ncbi:hypothetical protein ABZ801_18880 [Actinomadura sp. NPDC047616]|uniref:hypothetical protein n=1 Tax=Actinomadura sp. NPDC047616 TaxID=3155914 RepID=UPI0033FFE647
MNAVRSDGESRAVPLKRRLRYGTVASLIMLAGLGVTGSPYHRVGPGPVIQVGGPADGSWSVTTVRIRRSTWFQWAVAELSGERTIRGGGDSSPATATATDRAMGTAQTNAVLVAAQLAARRTPGGGTGLQVTDAAPAIGLRPGDILLAAGDAEDLAPLRTQADLRTAPRRTGLRVLVVPRSSDDSWGKAEIRRIPAARLARVRARPDVSATAYPLGAVRGPSAGLVLALARADALTPGDLTGGRRVAGTGGIGPDGTVTGVGEVADKVRAAVAARADVFFVPVWQRAAATAAARGTGVRIVPVRSATEAVGWLCATGGHAPIC